ncbi:hypothetical protein [Phytohabitans kaempferiae]|uniref:Uncharacterized protein n=1 Tax=Phytohabitans kaempferiae TaxID=1620943 RepID=A0ABV6MCC7_9ACTN
MDVNMTTAGRAFIRGAKPMAATADKLVAMTQAANQGRADRSTLAHNSSVSAGDPHATMTSWRDGHPDVEYVVADIRPAPIAPTPRPLSAERINATDHALGASVSGDRAGVAIAAANRPRRGAAWVHRHPGMGPDLPFVGLDHYGLGVERSHRGLEANTDVQALDVLGTV